MDKYREAQRIENFHRDRDGLEPVTRQEFDDLVEDYFKLERTVYGIQQLLGKAAEYKGKPRGRLPR